ncbi:MAG: hypothetical protein LBE13_01355, partial [Bacteroidales bacterium]|nr:hypothetical protein [Bacteroidales bacterium]
MKLDVIKKIIQRIERPVYLQLRGWYDSKIYEDTCRERTKWSVEKNIEQQKIDLYETIIYSIHNIPYYREIANKKGINPSKETIFSDIQKFPILTKDIIREHFDELKSELPGVAVHTNTSGGSTGVPVQFLQDHYFRMKSLGLIFDEFSGYEFGDKLIKLWGSERDIIQGSDKFRNKIANLLLYRQKLLNSFRMSEQDMGIYVKKINKFRPKYMIAYVQSVYELAKFIEQKGIFIHKMRGIITSAGTLYDDFRKKIESVFQCPVYNRYGSREVGQIAMECSKHEGLHLNIFNKYIEILNSQNEAVYDGQMGRIIITTTNNFIMPLIRFDIGDMGIPTSRVCSCGIGLPLLAEVKGRTVNVFRTKNNTLIDGEYFTHLFYRLDFIKQFQIIQQDYSIIDVHYVLSYQIEEDKLNAIFDDMRRKIWLVMGNDCQVRFVKMHEIIPSASGKYIFTISNLS